MKTIIVATDYSAEATNAMHYAASLARQIRAPIVLFNSCQLPEDSSRSLLSSTEIEMQLVDYRAYLESIAIKNANRYGIRVDCWTNLTCGRRAGSTCPPLQSQPGGNGYVEKRLRGYLIREYHHLC